MAVAFQVCQGTCLCAPSTEGYGRGKVLYCYGEVVLQRPNLRPSEEEEKTTQWEEQSLQLVQLVAVAVLLTLVFFVLLSICQGVSKLQGQLKKVLQSVQAMASPPPSRSNTMERKKRLELTSNGGNGHCVKFHEERERTHVFPSSDSTELDSQHS